MALYNLTAIGQNTTGLYTLTQTTSEVLLFGWGGTLLLIGICLICFISFFSSTNDFRRSITPTFFIGFLLSFLLKAVGLVPSIVMWVFLVGAGASIALSFLSKD